MSQPIVKLENVSKDYIQGGITIPAVSEVDLSVDGGEFLVVTCAWRITNSGSKTD